MMEALKEEEITIQRLSHLKSVGSKMEFIIGFKTRLYNDSNGDFIATHDDLLIGHIQW